MSEYLKWLTDLISQLGNWGYVLLALISFLEAIPLVGFFIPGVVILIFGGWLVAENVFDFFDLVVICAAFTLLGDMVAFAWGRRFSGSFKKEHKIMKEEYLIKAKNFITKRGTSGIFLGRFISPVRSTLYFVLGIIKMPWLKFIIPVAISSFIFSFFYVGVGYLAGNAWRTFEVWSGRLAAAIGSAILIIILLWWLKGFLVHQGKQLKNLAATAVKTFFTWYQRTANWQKFSSHHSLISRKIIKLTNPNKFFGLPLSALVLTNIILASLVFCFGLLVQGSANFIVDFDYRLQAFIKLFSEAHLAVVMFFITMFGSPYFVLAVGFIFSFWLFWEKRKSYIMGLWITISGVFLSSSLIKIIIARPRPVPTFLFESSYSFPSFHATIAIALLMYLAYYAIRAYPRWSRNISLFLIAVLFVLAIGFSRVYLGVHYFSDIIGGYLIGAFWFIVAVISQRFLQSIDQPRRSPKMFQIIILSGMVVLVVLVYCSQIFKSSSVSANFFSALSKVAAEQQNLISADKLPSNLLLTENLRGGSHRPINFIFNVKTDVLDQALVKAGWVKRLDPTLSAVIRRVSDMILKRAYPDAPLRPRFWNNQPNSITFTKVVPSNKQIDFYILRLWPVSDSQVAAQQKFMAELVVNKDFSLW